MKTVFLLRGDSKPPQRPQELTDDGGGEKQSAVTEVVPAAVAPAAGNEGDLLKRIGKVIVSFGALLFLGGVVLLEMVVRGTIAASIAFTNTLGWVVIVFATAAPMMLSGLYEANVDRQILDAITKSRRFEKAKADERAARGLPADALGGQQGETPLELLRREVHLLYAILVGNLVIPVHPPGVPRSGVSDPAPTPDPTAVPQAEADDVRAWNDIGELVGLLDEAGLAEQKEATRSRLHTMLNCQVSFGASIGAPVVFYLGSFMLSVFSNINTLGDNDTSHALAFGEWWMTIPHVAVVSGCLLAGNNPNTLKAVMSGITSRHSGPRLSEDDDDVKPTSLPARIRGLVSRIYENAFSDADYEPVWMFDRGRNKKRWIRNVQRLRLAGKKKKREQVVTHQNMAFRAWLEVKGKFDRWWARFQWKYRATAAEEDLSPLSFHLPDSDLMDWLNLIVAVVVLLLIPFVLAYLTSYYTPLIGLSCRSFTFVLYFIFQLFLGALWLWDFQFDRHLPFYRTAEVGKGEKKRTIVVPTIFGATAAVGFFGSAFTAIAGTFLQIVGVYRNCLCSLPMNEWSRRDDAYITISSNGAEDIFYAQKYWLATGVASIVLLIAVCYFGWWYQRHWRNKFSQVVDEVLGFSGKKGRGHAATTGGTTTTTTTTTGSTTAGTTAGTTAAGTTAETTAAGTTAETTAGTTAGTTTAGTTAGTTTAGTTAETTAAGTTAETTAGTTAGTTTAGTTAEMTTAGTTSGTTT